MNTEQEKPKLRFNKKAARTVAAAGLVLGGLGSGAALIHEGQQQELAQQRQEAPIKQQPPENQPTIKIEENPIPIVVKAENTPTPTTTPTRAAERTPTPTSTRTPDPFAGLNPAQKEIAMTATAVAKKELTDATKANLEQSRRASEQSPNLGTEEDRNRDIAATEKEVRSQHQDERRNPPSPGVLTFLVGVLGAVGTAVGVFLLYREIQTRIVKPILEWMKREPGKPSKQEEQTPGGKNEPLA